MRVCVSRSIPQVSLLRFLSPRRALLEGSSEVAAGFGLTPATPIVHSRFSSRVGITRQRLGSFTPVRSPSLNIRLLTVPTHILFQGIKRSITSLEGGTLGYAEIIAIKVRQHGNKLGNPHLSFSFLVLVILQ